MDSTRLGKSLLDAFEASEARCISPQRFSRLARPRARRELAGREPPVFQTLQRRLFDDVPAQHRKREREHRSEQREL